MTSMDADNLILNKKTVMDEDVFETWISYMYLCLAVILITRLIGLSLPILLPLLVDNLLPSARRRRAAQTRIGTDLRELRAQQAQLNMVDNFAVYSKLERKKKALEREQASFNNASFGTSVSFFFILSSSMSLCFVIIKHVWARVSNILEKKALEREQSGVMINEVTVKFTKTTLDVKTLCRHK